MEQIFLNSNLLLYVALAIFIVVIFLMSIIVYKEKKQDEKEIEEILNSIEKNKPKEKVVDQVKEEDNELAKVIQKMEQDANIKSEEVVESFEHDQEEKAIISYRELIRSIEVENEKEPIKYEKVEIDNIRASKPISRVKLEDSVENIVAEIKNPVKFKNSEFISPIYGKNKPNKEEHYNINDYLEDFTPVENTSESENFLESLKEFRKTL